MLSMFNLVFPWSRADGDPSMSEQTQISAAISTSTRERLDRFAEAHGLKKNYVVEHALLMFMAARSNLPDEAFIPTRIVLDDAEFDRLADLLAGPPPPTPALRKLLRGAGD